MGKIGRVGNFEIPHILIIIFRLPETFIVIASRAESTAWQSPNYKERTKRFQAA